MKRFFIGIGTVILAILLSAGLFGCGQKKPEGSSNAAPTKGGKNAVTLDFENIEVTETGTMAFSTVYSCKRTEKGVHVEYYIFQDGWDEENGVKLDEKRMIHSFDGDEKVYQKIAKILGAAPVNSWDGFSESNSGVEDGSSFSLDVQLSDGTKVAAHGNNSFPEGYRDFVNQLDAVCSTELVEDTSFETSDYSFKVPESWVGNVYAVYRDGMIGFEVKTKKKDHMILCFYQAPYDIGRDLKDYVSLVSFMKADQTWFVKMRRMADSYNALEKMNSKQQEICNSLDEDMKTIKSSFTLKGSYEIVEDPDLSEGETSYVSGYYTDPNSSNSNSQEETDKENKENTEENGETSEKENGEENGDEGGSEEEKENEGGDDGGSEGGDEGSAGENSGGEDGESSDE